MNGQSGMIETLGSRLKLKYVLSYHINNINHVSKFHAPKVVSLLIKIVEILTSIVFLRVQFCIYFACQTKHYHLEGLIFLEKPNQHLFFPSQTMFH